MKFITVDTAASPKLERLRRSCRYHGIPLEVIGEGRPYPGHGAKIAYVIEYLSAQEPDEIVMFVDGYDVVFLAGAEEIERKFDAFGHPLVFSTEQNCNVNGGFFSRFPVWLRYPKGKRPYRFINSGSYIGRAGYMREFLQRIDATQAASDQTVINRYYVKHPSELALDYDQEIFTCTAGRTGLEEEDYRVEDGRLRNLVTDSLPCVLHCPGKNFIGLEKIVSKLPIGGSPYKASETEARKYRKSRRINRINARLLPDNFLFHLILDGLLVLLGVFALAAASKAAAII
ncbi:hypothetical protein HPQ64_15410 [Rhizobiales bacterium]|uniref:glycosyltransferase domain-containing protein n=1 Tax=Hongsoonwoonella zoysiae TaxID=2821844 RepID=UPI001561281F|nr:glycosyltransferase domain-containing protein [Hongsoonwoonella zoysiae]NRG19078.1 hypothetical protein [Hongsoonwoonella zoysiae]